MKHEKWLSCLMGAILAFVGSVAGVGCVMTGFGMGGLISLSSVILLLACWSVVVAVLMTLLRGGRWLAVLPFLLAMMLVCREGILLQVESLLFKITSAYSAAYGWSIICWSEAVQPDTPATWGVAFLGCLSATGICWSVCRRKWLALGLAAGIFPLVLCCVVTDTVPGTGYLYLLLSMLILMALPHLAGQIRKANGIRLTAMLLVPVMLAMLVLFGQVTPENYTKQSAKLQQAVSTILQKLPFGGGAGVNVGISVGGISMDRVDLTVVGPQVRQNYAVMDVVAPVTKTLYLRGQALDSYDGMSWSLGSGGDQVDPYWPYTGLNYRGRMVITTRSIHPIKYVPYYITDMGASQEKGLAPQQQNGDFQTQYEMFLWTAEAGVPMYSVSNSLDGAAVYLELPDATRQRAEELLKQILTDERTMAEKAETIRYYVETSAEYSLNTRAMPEGETDFALWFLEKSDTGYCTHFASAAAVLLRAAGIPARYVTGYTVNTASSRRVTVTAEQAHAWVEYLDENLVWKVLEATPVDPENAQPRPTVPHPTEETTEPSMETTASTQESTEGTTSAVDTSESTDATTEPGKETTRPTGDATKPTEDAPSQEPEKQVDLTWLWSVLQIVCWATLGVGMVALQYVLRLRYRRKKMHTGNSNRQAINRWRYGKHLAKRLRCAMPERLDFLAEKAAYSQHVLTQQELEEFDIWLESKHQELSRWPLLPRIFVKLIFAFD